MSSTSIDINPMSDPVTVPWNMDIMHIVMSYANRRVVSNLMKTCNTLNNEGARYLLEDGVSLRREARLVKSFIWFMITRRNPNERFRRLTFLNKLSLDFDHPTEDAARLLAVFFETIARAASKFTSLNIDNAEALLTTYPPLGAAIANLTTLKALNLSSTGEHCATLLRTLQSSLVMATIFFGLHARGREDEVIPEHAMNPILLLEASQSTLESLNTSFSLSTHDGPCYANVTHLSLSCMPLPVIEDYIRAFPNILSLTTSNCSPYRDEPEVWDHRREMSMLYQAQSGSWRSLREYQGSTLVLWILGLTCHIPSIKLNFQHRPPYEPLEVDSNRLNDVLLDVRPSHLALILPGASSILDEAFRSTLCAEGRLQVLDLRVLFHINRANDTVSVGDILGLLVDVVRASSVPTFKLTLDLSWMGLERRRNGEGLPFMPFEVYL
ncbi:hypothetical protein LXA43DRAFT_1091426 [Ganoderma leucocontextum]|nr:hypothetical protein LXA43DRAFT_1091426 [Ganoderma leucocontextum]